MSFLKRLQSGSPIKKLHLSKKTIIASVIIIVVGLGAWFVVTRTGLVSQYLNPKSSKAVDKAVQVKAEKASAAYNAAYTEFISGDEAAAQATLDKEMTDSSSSMDKAKVYLQKTSIAMNSGDYKNAYIFAKKADELNPTKASAQMMAMAAVQDENISEAITDYKLALSRIAGTSGMDELDKQELKDKIKDLGGSL